MLKWTVIKILKLVSAKAVYVGKFIALSVYIRKEKRLKINDLNYFQEARKRRRMKKDLRSMK